MSTKLPLIAFALVFSISGLADASRVKKGKGKKATAAKRVKSKASLVKTTPRKISAKLKAPTHFGYRQLRNAKGASTGFIKFPKALGAKTRRLIAEFAPGHLYNPVFVQAVKLPGGGYEIAAQSRVVGGPGVSARIVAGSAKSQVKALESFAAELSALTRR